MINFIKKRHKLLFWSISFLTFVTKYLLASVNWTMLQLILLKDKDPNPPPAPPPEPPPMPKPEEPKRKVFQLPYVPAWVAASFKNVRKHPLYGGITVSTLNARAPAPLPALSVVATEEPVVVEVLFSKKKSIKKPTHKKSLNPNTSRRAK